ncbi:hypothetical protein GCM10022288_14580 [Gryllotalpicola kribbensis]|uniref:Uncharacterized protein n=1 Tax=Gryllotalpicola kribbensis TaxID=993084 RepID=A0ABP8AQT5_9MICO
MTQRAEREPWAGRHPQLDWAGKWATEVASIVGGVWWMWFVTTHLDLFLRMLGN